MDGAEPAGLASRHLQVAAGIVFAIVVLDQLTKLWAVRALADGPVSIVGDSVDFRLARNTGGAFSLFQAFTPMLAIVAIVVAYFLVRTVRRTHDPLLVVALSLVLGGAVGNLLDRIFRSPGFLRGAVVDFVHVSEWPTFNLADSAITIGAVMVVVWSFRTSARERAAG
ncbi:MAG TPA: signal peptidase II [Acidimicrobiia bacterium]|jgi:signal peptidase II